jgi:phosphoribosylamine--glycine ligase
MLTPDGPRVLEFNTRLGDPEAQAILLAFRGDILPMLLACAAGDLSATTPPPSTPAAVIVLAAEGYPLDPVKDALIVGVEEAEVVSTAKVFHAATRLDRGLRVNGGRVLGVAAHGNTPDEAVSAAYLAAACIHWPGMQYRTDIGKALHDS